ncbi:MAG: hypothetical protein DRH43_02835 [Deltaproteobacteria bacterium]|nr:MAG: hypothetical protein DRH43_02835 [Deltaproteobacteria bacterium]
MTLPPVLRTQLLLDILRSLDSSPQFKKPVSRRKLKKALAFKPRALKCAQKKAVGSEVAHGLWSDLRQN